MPPQTQQPQKNRHIPLISEAHVTGTALGDASACDMTKHPARENNLFPQTSADTQKYGLVAKHIFSKRSKFNLVIEGHKNVV